MKPVSPIGIDAVTYGVQDLGMGARFLQEFGLRELERGHGGATYCTAEGAAVHLRSADDSTLPPAIEAGSTIRGVGAGPPRYRLKSLFTISRIRAAPILNTTPTWIAS